MIFFVENLTFLLFLCDFVVSEWIKIKLNKDSLTLNDTWCEMKYHKKL